MQPKYEYNWIISQKVEFGLFRARQRYFQYGDKAGKLLYNGKHVIFFHGLPHLHLHIVLPKGGHSFIFGEVRPPRFESRSSWDAWRCNHSRRNKVIRTMRSGNSPGPDGLTAEFYKCFSDELTPLLLQMHNEAFERGVSPLTLSQALISLILKKGMESTDCKSYRPIPLISIDTKILSKILANCLSSVRTTLIRADQVYM